MKKSAKMQKVFVALTLGLFPVVTQAQRPAPKNFKEVVGLALSLLEMTIPIILSFALLVFFWGLAKMVWHGGNERNYAEGRRIAFYGVIALFVMLSVWGLVALLENTFLAIQGPTGGA